ncbi:hypothetical protein EDD15DRAFT_2519340, partial [Pisolithus albus]
MTTPISLESDSLSPLMHESVPYPMVAECLLTVRNSAVFGLMDKISIPLYLLVNLFLRGVTFFFCPMLTDVVNAGHLMCFEAHNVTIGVLYVREEEKMLCSAFQSYVEPMTTSNESWCSRFGYPSAGQRLVPRIYFKFNPYTEYGGRWCKSLLLPMRTSDFQ